MTKMALAIRLFYVTLTHFGKQTVREAVIGKRPARLWLDPWQKNQHRPI